jgi:hypothetical protein
VAAQVAAPPVVRLVAAVVASRNLVAAHKPKARVAVQPVVSLAVKAKPNNKLVG